MCDRNKSIDRTPQKADYVYLDNITSKMLFHLSVCLKAYYFTGISEKLQMPCNIISIYLHCLTNSKPFS